MKFYGIKALGKIILEKLTSMPVYSQADHEGRLIYDDTNNLPRIGDNTEFAYILKHSNFGLYSAWYHYSQRLNKNNLNNWYNLKFNTELINHDSPITYNSSNYRITLPADYLYTISYNALISCDSGTGSDPNIMIGAIVRSGDTTQTYTNLAGEGSTNSENVIIGSYTHEEINQADNDRWRYLACTFHLYPTSSTVINISAMMGSSDSHGYIYDPSVSIQSIKTF